MVRPDFTAADLADVRFAAFGFVAFVFLVLAFLADDFLGAFLAVFFFDVLPVRLRAVVLRAAAFFALRAGADFLAFLLCLLFDFVFFDFVLFAMADTLKWA